MSRRAANRPQRTAARSNHRSGPRSSKRLRATGRKSLTIPIRRWTVQPRAPQRSSLRAALPKSPTETYPIRRSRLARLDAEPGKPPPPVPEVGVEPYARWYFDTPVSEALARRSRPTPNAPTGSRVEFRDPSSSKEPPKALEPEPSPKPAEPARPKTVLDLMVDLWVRMERREFHIKDLPGEALVAWAYFLGADTILSTTRIFTKDNAVTIVLLFAIFGMLILSANSLIEIVVEYVTEPVTQEE